MSDLSKCPKCGSSKVHQIIGSDGEVSLLCCHSCGNNEPVYHLSEKGRKVLQSLLSTKREESYHVNSRAFPPWCVWDHRRKCPDKVFLCDTERHLACEHHRKHGDIDGNTCLLGVCALHYPKQIVVKE